MIDSTRLLLRAFPCVRSGLARHYGWRWPLALARCGVRWRTLVGQTRWAGRDDEEARHVRALALIPAVYLILRERLGAAALEVTRELAAAVLAAANARLAREASWSELRDPRARWHAFFDRVVARGVGAFNESECLSVEVERFHLRVRRCVFADLARDIGLPELARMTCDLAVPFCRELLPSYEFRRNGSLESTLAYGHPHCDYLWEPKAATGDDARAPALSTAVSRTAEEQPAAGPAPALGPLEAAERSDA
jgi:hypothetical protein